MTFNIRPATENDIDILTYLREIFCAEDKHDFDKSRTKTLFTKIINDGDIGLVFIAEKKSNIVGYAFVANTFSLEFNGYDAWLDELFVLPEYRHEKIGSELIKNAVSYCRNKGFWYLHLEAMEDNVKVHPYYKKHGFNARRSRHYVMPLIDGIPTTTE